MMRMRHVMVALAGLLVLQLTTVAVRSDDPVTSAVRFNREVVRIFERKCLSCHGSGGLAMPLSTYREARPWSRAIREELLEGRMPPWPAARGYATFQNDISLTPRELSTILTWVDGGVPRGDESDLPAPAAPPAAAAPPDHVVRLPEQQIPAGAEDVIRRVTVRSGLAGTSSIRQVQVRPGERRVLKAAFVWAVTKGRAPLWIGAWMPWQSELTPPALGTFAIHDGADLVVELHYYGQDRPLSDVSEVALFFGRADEQASLESIALEAPAPRAKSPHTSAADAHVTLPRDTAVWALHPEGLAGNQSLEVKARRPDGSVEVLLWIPAGHSAWPTALLLKEPAHQPAGTVLSSRVTGSGSIRTRTVVALQPGGQPRR